MLSNRKPNFILEKFYALSIKAVILVIPFLSLYVSPSMIFPYITGKNFAFRILVEIATVLWMGLMVLDKEYRPRNSAMLLLVLAFTFIVGLADLTGANPFNSLWSTYERMDGYLNIMHLCLYFMLIKSVFRSKNDWVIYLNIFVLVSFLMNIDTLFNILKHKVDFLNDIYILLQKVGYRGTGDSSFFRPLGRIGNAAFLAAYLLLTMLISMILAFNAKRLWLKAVYAAAIGLNLLFVYFTATRGAMLALVIGIISFSLFYVFGKAETGQDRLLRKISAAVLVGVALLSILFFVFRDSSLIKQNPTFSRISTISTSDTTTQLRLITWSMAWEGIKERPVLGWGQENFPHIYTKYFNPRLYGLETWIDHAHNVVLDWLVNAGFIGLLFYLGIFGMAFYILWSAFANKTISKTLAFTIISGLVVYFFQNLFVFDSINTNIIFFTLLAYVDNLNDIPASQLASQRSGKEVKNNQDENSDASRRVEPCLPAGRSATKLINPTCRTSPKIKPAYSPPRLYGQGGAAGRTGRSIFTAAAVLIIFAFFAYFINYKPIKEAKLITRLSVTPAYQAGMSDKHKSFFDVLEDVKQALAYGPFGDKYVRMSMAGISGNILKSGSISGPDSLRFIEATAVELEKHVAADPNNLENLYPIVTLLNDMAQYDAYFIKKAEVYIKECLRLSPK
ncbi:MAG: O-antigen ligase family protein, partial [Nitrospirota bacterium]